MIESLRQFAPFQSLDQVSLESVAVHARQVDLPRGRWLLRPGRLLTGHYYLQAGRIRTCNPDRVVRQSREAVYPGCGAICTLSPVRLLQVDVAGVALARRMSCAASPQRNGSERNGSEGNEPETSGTAPGIQQLGTPTFEAADDSWQVRFLRSHMLSELSPVVWQQLLGSLSARDCEPSEHVVRAGERGDFCYILAAGLGRVHRGGRTLRDLGPGDFFGEDALLAGAPRNATVTMVSAGRVMMLGEAAFRCWLVDALLEGREQAGCVHSNARIDRLELVTLDGVREKLASLDPCASYLVSGAVALRTLGVFLLRQRGIRAWVDPEPDPIGPGRICPAGPARPDLPGQTCPARPARPDLIML